MTDRTIPVHGGAYTIEEIEQLAAGTHVIVDRKVVPKPARAADPGPDADPESDLAPR